MNLQGDELEFAISQYLDGQLSAEIVGVLEERLATDPTARELLRQYRQIHTELNLPFPHQVAEASLRRIQQTVAARWDEAIADKQSSDKNGALLRMGVQAGAIDPIFSNTNLTPARGNLTSLHPVSNPFARLKSRRIAIPLALAASLLVAFTTIGLFVAKSKRAEPVVAAVQGPQVEAPSGAVVAEVSIGPAPSVASSGRLSHEDGVDRPSIVLIDRADNPPPDNDSIY